MSTSSKNLAAQSTSTTGTGTVTLGAAVSGYQALAAGDDGLRFDVRIKDGSAWEVARDCLYTHSGTTLTRGTLEESSTGSALSLSGSGEVYVIGATAERIKRINRMAQGILPGGRLTLTSGTPVTTSDVTGATTVYYTPYLHNLIPLWDGQNWAPVEFSETHQAELFPGKPG